MRFKRFLCWELNNQHLECSAVLSKVNPGIRFTSYEY
nr:MAG TPA: hypothetical protein [Caudoviricetes sp.]